MDLQFWDWATLVQRTGLPVMEGKAVLFKRFAAIDSVGICLDHVRDRKGKTDPKKVIEVTAGVRALFWWNQFGRYWRTCLF